MIYVFGVGNFNGLAALLLHAHARRVCCAGPISWAAGGRVENLARMRDALLEARADVAAQIENRRVGDVIEHIQPLLAAAQQAGAAQGLELALCQARSLSGLRAYLL